MKKHLVWLCVSVVALFVGTQFAKKEIQVVEKPVEVVKTREVIVEKPVEVIKEVPKEVEKIVERRVEVPAKIPELYENALSFTKRFQASELVDSKVGLAGIKSVKVAIGLTDDFKKYASETDLRTKFEITLRRSGVPIDEKSVYEVSYTVDGFILDGAPLIAYHWSTVLYEVALCFHSDGSLVKKVATTWERGYIGTVGTLKARETLISDSERAAETFANDWLAMNPKK